MKKVIVIGGGAAGMMAAISAAKCGAKVTLLEKNEKTGKKIYITGKGRCNVTNACDPDELMKKVVTNPRFLYSAFSVFSNLDVMNFFEENGVPLKIERGDRVFPVSDKSSDIISGLNRCLSKLKVEVLFHSNAEKLLVKDGRIFGVRLSSGKELLCDAVIVATGGLSYQSTGSTGDGYTFAKLCGHTVTPCFPSLSAFVLNEDYCKQLEGLSLKNVRLRVFQKGKELTNELGEMLFTANGISGPLVLTASAKVTDRLERGEVTAVLDFKPALSKEELDTRLLKDFAEMKNKHFDNALDKLLPQKIIPTLLRLSGIPTEKQVNAITKEERARLVSLLKELTFHVKAVGDFSQAVITRGGVHVKEVNPSTMESKLVSGLYFAGEVLDVDAYTGGFNLQIAWSTGYLAGMCAAE